MITISLKKANLQRALNQLARKGSDLREPLSIIGEIVVSSIDKNFQVEGRHNGDPDSIFGGSKKWAEWSPNWEKRRRDMGKLGKILTLNGGLAASVSYEVAGDAVTISSAKIYASSLHHGDKNRGLPARPFMVIQDEDLDEINEVLASFLLTSKK